MWWLCQLAFGGPGDATYLDAMRAWEANDWDEALRLARAAEEAEPGHRAARLLEGYALMKLRRHEDGVAVLAALEAEGGEGDMDREITRRAHRAWHRWADRRRRDQVSVAVASAFPTERRYTTWEARTGIRAEVEVPLPLPVEVRAGATTWFAGNGQFDVGGPRFDVGAVYRLPLGPGVWNADASLGPSVWSARGGFWQDGGQPYLGGRAAIGLDVRPTWRVGVRLEAGASWFPAATDELPWFGVPFDFSGGLVVWLGR